MKMITDPTNIIAKIQNMNLRDVNKCEKACLKSLKKAKDDVCVLKDKNGEFQFPISVMTQIINSLDERFNDLMGNGNYVIKKTQKDNVQPIAKESKKDYIDDTTKTKTTNSIGDKTMNSTNTQTTTNTKTTTLNKGENTMNKIAKIAPIAVKKILATQIVNKTDTKKTYWGGWGKVMNGMNAAFRDYNKFQELENQWSELRNRLGKGPKGHFCWSLINKNRVSNKQEPNSTLRFIKNVKIRIAMANDVLNGKYTETQINDYMNGLSQNYKIKYGLI